MSVRVAVCPNKMRNARLVYNLLSRSRHFDAIPHFLTASCNEAVLTGHISKHSRPSKSFAQYSVNTDLMAILKPWSSGRPEEGWRLHCRANQCACAILVIPQAPLDDPVGGHGPRARQK